MLLFVITSKFVDTLSPKAVTYKLKLLHKHSKCTVLFIVINSSSMCLVGGY